MKSLLSFDNELKNIIVDLKSFAEGIDLRSQPSLPVYFPLNAETINKIEEIEKSAGIYFFEIKNKDLTPFEKWYDRFKKRWDSELVKYTPSPSQKRADKHKDESLEWVPLYIGKATDVQTRIKQHIEGYSSTYSLRLKEHKFLKDDEFRVTVFYLGKLDCYEVIATVIESTLRDKINPIVGKQ